MNNIQGYGKVGIRAPYDHLKTNYYRMKQLLISFYIVFLSSIALSQNQSIIPAPLQVQKSVGKFTLSEATVIAPSQFPELSDYLQLQIKSIVGLDLKVANGASSAISLAVNSDLGDNEEAYYMKITPNQISIVGKTEKGIFYGIQSLIQLLPVGKSSKTDIPCQTINDAPRFAWRGMLLDVSRHFVPKNDVKKFIDLLALHKLNVLHWHLTDDQGWRIEIKKYPKLTSVGAWREDRRGEVWNIDDEQREPYPAEKPLYGGYYTQDDIREIVRYASVRNVQIIPEIEMPGHSRAALVAYPQFSCFGKETKVASAGYVGENWDFSDPYCAGNDETFTFIENILEEVMALFPTQYIHVGGDECSKRIWKTCTKCQKRIKDEKLKNEFELQSYFISRIEKYINSKGKRMIGWQEILEGGMNPSAIIQPWKDETALEVALEAAKAGHQLIMSPSTHLYFDKPWTETVTDRAISLEKTYNYEPVPEGLDTSCVPFIKGLEACMWAELTPGFSDVEYQSLPRMAALAEVGWSTKENKNWINFETRLTSLKQLYKHLAVNYYVPMPLVEQDKTIFTDKAEVRFGKSVNGNSIRYTTNGTEPTMLSKAFKKPFTITKSTTYKVAAFDKWGQKSKTTKVVFEKQTYRNPVKFSNSDKGFSYQLYSGKIRNVDHIESATPTKNGTTDSITVIDRNGNEHGGMILNGHIQVPEKGIYTFYLASDDGSKLYIGDYCVVDNNGFTAAKNSNGEWLYKTGKIALEKGIHPITIRYFDWGGGENLRAMFEGPGIVRQNISAANLFSVFYTLPLSTTFCKNTHAKKVAKPTGISTEIASRFSTNEAKYRDVSERLQKNWYLTKVDSVKGSWVGNRGIILPEPFLSISKHHFIMYYWDTYFANKGILQIDSLSHYARLATDNLLWVVDSLGFAPNSTMNWGMNRSQPPFLAQMVDEVYAKTGDKEWLKKAYQTLKKEYHFWTDTSENAIEVHTTSVPGLQRYGHHASPAEMMELVHHVYERGVITTNPATISDDSIYKIANHFMAEAATGMDFCSRFDQRCADHIPVCLNSNLYALEMLLDKFGKILNLKNEPNWKKQANTRKKLINKYLWNEERGIFLDYNYRNHKSSSVMSVASLYPLTVGLATKKQAARTVQNLHLLETQYGISTTEQAGSNPGLQWDYPSGWPPMFSQTVDALHRYGYKDDAARIALKYLDLCAANFYNPMPAQFVDKKGKTETREPGFVYEKYNVRNGTISDNEYPSRPFWGWSAGVYVYCLNYFQK